MRCSPDGPASFSYPRTHFAFRSPRLFDGLEDSLPADRGKDSQATAVCCTDGWLRFGHCGRISTALSGRKAICSMPISNPGFMK